MTRSYSSCGKVYNCCPDGEHMSNKDLISYLHKLGLSLEKAQIFSYLSEVNEATPLLIARQTGINRTKVYRLLEEMAKEKLVAQEIGEHSTRVSPANTERLLEILKAKQLRVAELTKNWNSIEEQINQMSVQAKAETKVKYYRGKAGIEQMVWNVLKAKSEIVGYTFRDLSHFVGEKFMGEFTEEFKRRNLTMRDIYGDEYKDNNPLDNNWGGRINSRYLPKEILSIPHQMDIYDNVVSFYGWNEEEVWGTEIYNEKAAQMQKQLFELAWEKAKKI